MYPITNAEIDQRKEEIWHPLLQWVDSQSQDVWGQIIYSVTGHMSAVENCIEWWLIDQPRMAQANAVRLFHEIFDWDLYLGTKNVIDDPEHGGSERLLGLRTLAERIDNGYYARTELGLSDQEIEAYRYRTLASHHARELEDPRNAPGRIFDFPTAALTTIPGRPLDPKPEMVEPPLPNGSECDLEFCEEYRSLCRQMTDWGPEKAAAILRVGAKEKAHRQGAPRPWWQLRARD